MQNFFLGRRQGYKETPFCCWAYILTGAAYELVDRWITGIRRLNPPFSEREQSSYSRGAGRQVPPAGKAWCSSAERRSYNIPTSGVRSLAFDHFDETAHNVCARWVKVVEGRRHRTSRPDYCLLARTVIPSARCGENGLLALRSPC